MQAQKRPTLAFTVPDVINNKPADPAQFELHQQRLKLMLAYDMRHSWMDSYFLAFGYATIQPFHEYIEIAPNSVSSLTGCIVVTEDDYLDVIYAQHKLEQMDAQVVEELPATASRGRPRLNPVELLERNLIAAEKQKSKELYQQACEERRKLLSTLWTEYQQALAVKKQIVDQQTEHCNRLLKDYMQLKTVPVSREDFK